MNLGYARTSTVDQIYSIDNQVKELKDAGCGKIFREQISAVASIRPEFDKMIDYAREGDQIIFKSLDRGFRSVRDMSKTMEALEAKGVTVRVLNINMDTSTATGKLFLNILCSISEFEKSILLERQRVGIERAKKDKKYTGRKPSIDSDEIKRLHASGMGASEIARTLNIGRASVYRLLG